MKIHPLNKHVLIEPDEEAETIEAGGQKFDVAKTKGEKTEARAIKAKVLAIADDALDFPKMVPDLKKNPPIKVGDIVFASYWDGKTIYVEGKKLMLIEYQYLAANVHNE